MDKVIPIKDEELNILVPLHRGSPTFPKRVMPVQWVSMHKR